MGKNSARSDEVCFTSKGQVVIPIWLRRRFGIQEGTRAVVVATSDGILVRPVTEESVRQGRGIIGRSATQASTIHETKGNKEMTTVPEMRHGE